MASIAIVGGVYAIYQLNVGSVADAHVSAANHPSLESSRKKAGYTAFVLVSALTLITRDGNVGALGYGSIVAMDLSYRHAIMSDHAAGRIIAPSPAAYQPAGQPANVTQIYGTADQTDAVGY